MERQANSGTVILPSAFHSDIEVTLKKELYDAMVERMIEKMDTFQSMGSGWILRSVTRLELHTVRYSPVTIRF